MPIALLWLQLVGTAAVILVASNFLAKSADVIALKTGLGRSFTGIVLLATATSLPELGTGVSSITFVGDPDLAAGDAFGSNLFNLLIIGLLGVVLWRNADVLRRVAESSVRVGGLGIIVISLAAIAIYVHSVTDVFSGWHVSPVTIVMFVVFLGAMYVLYLVERSVPGDEPGSPVYSSASLSRSGAVYAVSAVVIVAAAVWLARTGEEVAHAMNWSTSFVGTQFLALSTSLPELAASFAAIRINAHELAFSNVLGSNLFNMGFVLTVDDIALVGTPLWDAIAPVHAMTAVFAVLMTSVVVVIAAMNRLQIRPARLLASQTAALIALYLIASVLVFWLG